MNPWKRIADGLPAADRMVNGGRASCLCVVTSLEYEPRFELARHWDGVWFNDAGDELPPPTHYIELQDPESLEGVTCLWAAGVIRKGGAR